MGRRRKNDDDPMEEDTPNGAKQNDDHDSDHEDAVPSRASSSATATPADASPNASASPSPPSTAPLSSSAAAVSRPHLFAAVEESIFSCAPLLKFFYGRSETACGDDNGGGGADLTAKERRERREAVRAVVRSRKFHRGHARRLFSGLMPVLRRVIGDEAYVPASAFESDGGEDDDGGDDGSGGGEGTGEEKEHRRSRPDDAIGGINGADGSAPPRPASEIIPDPPSTEALLYLRACAELVESYLDGLLDRHSFAEDEKKRRRRSDCSKGAADGREGAASTKLHGAIDEAFGVAEVLHDALFSLDACGKEGAQTQSAIFAMCERWWHGRFEDREHMVAQLVPLLVVKSLDGSARRADVKRLCAMRDAADLLDFDDGSIAFLRTLILRAASSPLFLREGDGRKFLAHAFRWQGFLTGDLHRAMRAQIPGAKPSVLKAYGDIYFKAWKAATATSEEEGEDKEEEEAPNATASPSVRSVLEETALQDLTYVAIHASNPTVSKNVRTVLEPFHDAKKNPDVEALLHRSYGPILWRALSCANARVRVQAASILSDVFPLRDPDGGKERTEACVSKCVAALAGLLDDDVPAVRAAGSACAAKILVTFWVALPSDDIRLLLNHIIARHASDTTSSNVRATAVQAITTLLTQECTHAVLRPLLPSLGNLIHDKVERVRLAVVRMLLTVKSVRGMKYYHVVPPHHLLARLEEEGRGSNNPTGPAASSLTELLRNSFYPSGKRVTNEERLDRTLKLLKDNPGAGLVFYRNVSAQLSVNSVCKLIAVLMNCLCSSIESENREAGAAAAGEEGGKGGNDRPSYGNRRTKKRGRSNGARDDNDGGGDNKEEGGGGGKTADESNDQSLVDDQAMTDNPTNFVESFNYSAALIASIAESMLILWQSIELDLRQPQCVAAKEFLREVCSGAILTDAYLHFRTKLDSHSAAADGSDNVETSAADDESFDRSAVDRRDRFRTCAAILSCAGKMDADSVDGLRLVVIEELAASGKREGGLFARSSSGENTNYCPHVALLCAWGMTEDVAECLGSSIIIALDDDGEGGVKETSDKNQPNRKRKKKKKGGRTSAADNRDSSGGGGGAIPPLRSGVALRILGSILRGSDPSAIFARETLFASDTVFAIMENALERATSAAENILRPSIAKQSKLTESHVFSVVATVECYARLVMHKEAMKGKLPLEFTDQAKALLTWVAERVAPVLANVQHSHCHQQNDNTLRGLDLSRISNASSQTVLSPVQKYREGRASTSSRSSPPRLSDATFGSMAGRASNDVAFTFHEESVAMYTRAAAISFIDSVLSLFSEWITIGGGGGDEIASQISIWCGGMLGGSDASSRKVLLPTLLRLSLALLRTCSDVSVVKEVMLSLRDVELDSVDEDAIRSFAAALVAIKDAGALEVAIVSIVRAVQSSIQEPMEIEDDAGVELDHTRLSRPSLNGLGGCFEALFSSIVRKGRSGLLLAKYLMTDEGRSGSDGTNNHPSYQLIREGLFNSLRENLPLSHALQLEGILPAMEPDDETSSARAEEAHPSAAVVSTTECAIAESVE